MNNTVEKTLDILELISRHREGVSLAQLSKELSIPKSTAFNIIQSLCQRSIVAKSDDAQPTYSLGVGALKLGLSYLSDLSPESVVRPVLSALCQSTNETVFMSVPSGKSHMVYVMKYLSDREFQTSYSVGAVRPMMSIAMGKAVLAAMSEEKVRELLTPEQLSYSNHAELRDIDSVLSFLERTRELGYVVDDTSENPFYAGAVAAPLRDVNGATAGAISIVIMHDPGNPQRIARMGGLVQKAAMEISRGLGYQGESLYR